MRLIICWSVSQQAIMASRMTAAAGSASWSSGLPAGLTLLGAPRSAGAARRALTAAARGRCARRRRDRLPAGSAQMARISVAAPIRHTAVQARRSIEGTSLGSVLPRASAASVSRSWIWRLCCSRSASWRAAAARRAPLSCWDRRILSLRLRLRVMAVFLRAGPRASCRVRPHAGTPNTGNARESLRPLSPPSAVAARAPC